MIAARTRIEHEGQVPDKRRGQTQHTVPCASPLSCRLYSAPSLQFEVCAGCASASLTSMYAGVYGSCP